MKVFSSLYSPSVDYLESPIMCQVTCSCRNYSEYRPPNHDNHRPCKAVNGCGSMRRHTGLLTHKARTAAQSASVVEPFLNICFSITLCTSFLLMCRWGMRHTSHRDGRSCTPLYLPQPSLMHPETCRSSPDWQCWLYGWRTRLLPGWAQQ